MDFDYDPCDLNLNEFWSNSFDEKIKKESEKLKVETENLDDSTEILLCKQVKPKNTRKSLDNYLKKNYNEPTKNTEKLISHKKNELDSEYNTIEDPEYVPKKTRSRKKEPEKNDLTNVDIQCNGKNKENSVKQKRITKRAQIAKINEDEEGQEEVIEVEDAIPYPDFSTASQRGRARRNYMASLASSLPTLDVIDLESSLNNINNTPTTHKRSKKKNKTSGSRNRRSRPSNLIVIGSDSGTESEHEAIKFNSNISLISKINCEDDEDNPEIQILIEWDHKIEKLKIRKYQKFQDIIDLFAKKENVSSGDILFNINDKIIIGNDTIDNINYKFGDIISGRVVENCQSYVSNFVNTTPKPTLNKNEICLKIQSNHWKNPIEMFVKKNDNFKILYIQCAETFKLNISSFILRFDGDQLIPNDTPEDLDMEGGEIIDCVIKK